jgi:hypothetical protein
MSRGNSGRIVLEIDPKLKKELYIALAKENVTLKLWFLRNTEDYIRNSQQPALFAADTPERYSPP